jgi:hypothetical protein
MDSPATSLDIAFLNLDGGTVDQPHEWTEALIHVTVEPTKWDSLRLTVNGAAQALTLRRIGGCVRVVAEWPRSNAGSYMLRAELSEKVATRRISIAPRKLSPGAFEVLLSDLESRLPAAVAIGLQQTGGLVGLTVLPPEETTVAQEVARLRRAITGGTRRPGLATVLPNIARDPHRVLEVDELWARTHEAKRPHPAHLMHAVRSHANMVNGDLPLRVIDQRVHETVDVYENRLVRLFHDQVVQRLLRIQRHLERTQNSNSAQLETVTGLRADLSIARREASFLDEVSSTSHLPTTVTMVLQKRPAYRAAFEGYLELHRSIAVRLDDSRLDLPLETLPELYQLWGTLSACAALLQVAAAQGYRVEYQHLVHRDLDGAFIRMVPAGRTALRLVHPLHGTAISLTPEQAYGPTGSIRSISFRQVPDITIMVERPGAVPDLLLLDPKYKLDSDPLGAPETDGRPKKVDIDKMHAYRDAIRDADGRHVVSTACTIYPGPTVQYAQGIEAIQGDPKQSTVLDRRITAVLEKILDPHI